MVVPLVLVLGYAAPSSKGTTYGFEAQRRAPCLQEIRQQCIVEDNTHWCVHSMCAQLDQMEDADGRSAVCYGTQCAQTSTARGSRRQEEARASGIASGRTCNVQMMQMLVCRLFGLRAVLAI